MQIGRVDQIISRVLSLVFFLTPLSVSWAANNLGDYNTHNSINILNIATSNKSEETENHTCYVTNSPVKLKTREFVWSDTDIVLAGRPAIYLTRHYRSFDAREGIFGKGWHTRCEKSLTRTIGFVKEDGSASPKPLVKYIYRTEIGKRYEFWESSPNIFKQPDGLPDRKLKLDINGVPSMVLLDGSTETYNKFGQLVSEADRNGNRVNYAYADGALRRIEDTNGRFLELNYDSLGHVSEVFDHSGRVWAYSYNEDGTLESVTDPAGGVKRYEYISSSRQFDGVNYPTMSKIVDESGRTIISVDYGEYGRVSSYTIGTNQFTYAIDSGYTTVTDSFDSIWYYSFDEFGHKTEVWPPIYRRDGMRYEYDKNGNITKYTDLVGTMFSYDYDDMGRLVSSTDPDGTINLRYQGNTNYLVEVRSVTGRTVNVKYDERGNTVTITDPVGNVSTMSWSLEGDLLSTSDPLGNTATQTYNAIGLVTKFTDPLLRSTEISYDPLGNLISITDADGEVTRMAYDVLDRLVSTTDALGHLTQYSYDASGRLLSVIDARGGTTTFAYDIHGRLASETRADESVFAYSYRDDNLLESMTDPRGIVTNYTYDAGKRMTQVTAGSDSYSYIYDIQGRVTRATSDASTLTYTYDSLHRVLTETQDNRTTSYRYNAESELVGLNYEGEDLTYAYDDRGLLSAFVSPSGIHSYVHDAAGRLVSHTRPNGNAALMKYDAASQLLEQDYSQVSGEVFQYSYDNLGRILTIIGDGNADWNYQYDGIHRLISADHEQSYNYQYDALSNRSENSGVYDIFSKLLEDNDFNYDYDAMGSLISRVSKATSEETRYGYNSFARLISFERAPAVGAAATTRVKYGYDAFGRRSIKDGENFQTRFRWSGNNLIAEYDGGGSNTALYRYDGGYSSTEYSDRSGTYDVLSDQLGSAKRLVDDQGNIAWRNNTDPYGAPINGAGAVTVEFNQHFPGQYFDRESGLKYNSNRYYDPTIGKYLKSDPIGLLGGKNSYLYANASPTSFIDPSGLSTMCENIDPVKMGCGSVASKRGGGQILGAGIVAGSGIVFTNTLPEIVDNLNSRVDDDGISVPFPPKNKGRYTCICRAQADGRSTKSCTVGSRRIAYGYGEGATAPDAKRAAEKMAKEILGATSTHHIQCRCTNRKGQPFRPHG